MDTPVVSMSWEKGRAQEALSLHSLHTLQPDREKKVSTSASSAGVALSLHTLQPLSLHTLQPLGARPAAPCAVR